MTTPPQGGWQPDPHGRPPHGQPQYGPPQGYPGQQPPGFPPGQWPQQPPPAKGGGTLRWLLIAVVVLLVISISVGVTLIVTRDDGDEPSQTADASTSDIASANDTGPVAIIMEEPTCEAFNTINNSLADVQKGWGEVRGTLGLPDSWTAAQRQQLETVSRTMRNAAEQVVALAKQTPHRVVREIYEQFIAYGRAYADSIARYKRADDGLATANVSAGSAIIGICNSIRYGSAGRSISLVPEAPPSIATSVRGPAEATTLIQSNSQECLDWIARLDRFDASTSAWQQRNSGSPASEWTPERRATEQVARPLVEEFAQSIAVAGRSSGNGAYEDLAVTAALYLRAYLASVDTYTDADGWLSYAGFRLVNIVTGGCQAVG